MDVSTWLDFLNTDYNGYWSWHYIDIPYNPEEIKISDNITDPSNLLPETIKCLFHFESST